MLWVPGVIILRHSAVHELMCIVGIAYIRGSGICRGMVERTGPSASKYMSIVKCTVS